MNKSAIQFGLLSGLVLSVINALIYFINYELLANFLLGISLLVLIIALIVIGAVRIRKEFGPFDLKQAFITTFLICIGLIVVTTLYEIVLFTFIDPTFGETMAEIITTTTEEWMSKCNTPQEIMEEELPNVYADAIERYSMAGALKGLWTGALISAVFSIIVALIIRSKKD